MQKRQFLKVGIAGATLLAAAGAYYAATRNPKEQSSLVLTALVPALVGSALTSAQPIRGKAIADTVNAVQTAIAGLAPAAQKELDQLFALLASPVGHYLAKIDSWQSATPAQLTSALQSWREHRLALLQTAYHALHDLVLSSWYASPDNWAAIEYKGPAQL
jgi:hypothetical protein